MTDRKLVTTVALSVVFAFMLPIKKAAGADGEAPGSIPAGAYSVHPMVEDMRAEARAKLGEFLEEGEQLPDAVAVEINGTQMYLLGLSDDVQKVLADGDRCMTLRSEGKDTVRACLKGKKEVKAYKVKFKQALGKAQLAFLNEDVETLQKSIEGRKGNISEQAEANNVKLERNSEQAQEQIRLHQEEADKDKVIATSLGKLGRNEKEAYKDLAGEKCRCPD